MRQLSRVSQTQLARPKRATAAAIRASWHCRPVPAAGNNLGALFFVFGACSAFLLPTADNIRYHAAPLARELPAASREVVTEPFLVLQFRGRCILSETIFCQPGVL